MFGNAKVTMLLCIATVGLRPSQAFSTFHRITCHSSIQSVQQRMTSSDDKAFGVGEQTIEMRNLIEAEMNVDDSRNVTKSVVSISEVSDKKETSPTLSPSAVVRFLAPTLALWIAPPVMSLIDTSAVGRFCGPMDLAGTKKSFKIKLPLLRKFLILFPLHSTQPWLYHH